MNEIFFQIELWAPIGGRGEGSKRGVAAPLWKFDHITLHNIPCIRAPSMSINDLYSALVEILRDP